MLFLFSRIDWKSIELENNLNIGLFLRNITSSDVIFFYKRMFA